MLTVRSNRVVLPDGVRPAAILVRDGRIVHIGAHHEQATAIPVLDAGDLVILPGLVDTHVHVNEPGRTEWEGFRTATRAAAAGGVTTIVDMPLNSVPATTNVAALDEKLGAAAGKCHVDVAFWGGLVPHNIDDLEPLARRGVVGFKCFLTPSGVPEFECVSSQTLQRALPVLARLGLPLLVHAEDPLRLVAPDAGADPREYSAWLGTRPSDCEVDAIRMLIGHARESGARIHIVHLATSRALPLLREARAAGVPITVETCPHYLTFAAEDIPTGATQFKCAPPIRAGEHRDALWKALAEGDVDLIASDHSPAPPELKLTDGNFMTAWGGIASLQLGLSIAWLGASERGIRVDRLATWMSSAPARLAKLDACKGSIAVGCDADLVFFDPEAEAVVNATRLEHRHPITPYDGMRLRGRVRKTLLRGDVIFDDGEVLSAPRGRFVNIAGL